MRSRALSILVFAAACSHPAAPPPTVGTAPPAPPVTATTTLAQSGIVADWMDKSANPCTDFYQYACGSFMKTAVIPPDRASWGAVEMVTQQNEELLHQQLEKLSKIRSPEPGEQMLGRYYGACMAEDKIEAAGTAPLDGFTAQIAALKPKDPAGLAKLLGAFHKASIFAFFDLSPSQDALDATQVIADMEQARLGLPDRDYFLSSEGNFPKTLGLYREHLERLFALVKDRAPKVAAADVLRIETALATIQQSKVDRRDPHKTYNRVDRAGLVTAAPGFPWDAYFTAAGLADLKPITINSKPFFAGLAKLLTTEKLPALQHYLTYVAVRHVAEQLPKAFREEQLAMRKVLTGVNELPPRWRKCTNEVDGALGDLLGQIYVKLRFAGDAKARAVEMTTAIIDAMRATIGQLPWMDDATRAPAIAKLDAMAKLVGYPDKWKQYTFAVDDDYAQNTAKADAFELQRQWAKIGKPVDRFDWGMTPPTVNAYYEPSLNEIALPAGQLQPPFFGPGFHPAVNFGSTGGGTIGHEITHGFDDEGSQFDGAGNLRDWWSAMTKTKFEAATKCVVDQYADYEAVPGVKLDGKLTAGENIADIGGVKIAFSGYQTYKKAHPETPAKVEGITDDQLYFLAYGQSWCDKTTPAALETQAHSNPHSPAMWRVNGVIVDQPGFGAAFGCKAGTPMNPGKQCSVW